MRNSILLWWFLSNPVLLLMVNQAHAQGIDISAGGNVTVVGDAAIEITNGNFINNGQYTKGNESVTFSGTTASLLSGSSPTVMNNLFILNTAGVTNQISLISVNNLDIASNSKYTISPACGTTISGSISNLAGTTGLVLESGAAGEANLLHNTDNVPGTVERYIGGGSDFWHFLSSPVTGQNITGSWLPSGSYGNETGYDLYVWDEPTACWIYKNNLTSSVNWTTVHPESVFITGRGYLYSLEDDNQIKEFIGNLNNGTVEYELTTSGPVDDLNGFVLAGNPYPTYIDWSATLGWTRTVLKSTGGGYNIWVWNPNANNYGVFNSADGDGIGTNGITRNIAPTQAFFVQASLNGNLGMSNQVRVENGSGNWLKTTQCCMSDVRICVKSDEGYGSDEIQVTFGNEFNEDGATKLLSKVETAPDLYLSGAERKLSTKYHTTTDENPEIPLFFHAGKSGTYTISGSFNPGMFRMVVLEDRQLHQKFDLQNNAIYRFEASEGDIRNRFLLHFSDGPENILTKLSSKVYVNGNKLIVDLSTISLETHISIFDMTGRKLGEMDSQGSSIEYIELEPDTQIAVVCLQNQHGQLCQKLAIGKSEH